MSDPKTQHLLAHYYEAFEVLSNGKHNSQIEVSFYPYIGINHTIRVRSGRVYVRISEMCSDMPSEPARALAFILVAKLLNKKVPAAAKRVYSQYASSLELRERSAENKRSRGRKIVTTETGKYFDLGEVFDHINAVYFEPKLPRPAISWSARQTYRILGHHDAVHETIIISRSLDAADVPRYVIEFVMFHEMLHMAHPTRIVNGRRYSHTPEFRRDERKFINFAKAEAWIERNIVKIKKRVKGKNR